MAGGVNPCIFCQIAKSSDPATILYSDERVIAFQDINPSSFRHYLVIPLKHIPTTEDLQRSIEDYQLVSHMLNVGQNLLHKDARDSTHYKEELRHKSLHTQLIHTIWLSSTTIQQCGSSPSSLPSTTFHPKAWFSQVIAKRLFTVILLLLSFSWISNRWKRMKYQSLGPLGGFVEAEKLMQKIKPPTVTSS